MKKRIIAVLSALMVPLRDRQWTRLGIGRTP